VPPKGEKGVGIYNSEEFLVIGSWRPLILFLSFFAPVCREVRGRISYLGS